MTRRQQAVRVAVLIAATAMVVLPVWSAAAADDVPASYTVRGVGSGVYTTVDKCCSIIIRRLVEGGTAYVAGEMTLQRNLVTAAPHWPGELVATAPGTIGFASDGAVALPDLPGYARASTPGTSDDATEVPASGDVAGGTASVHSEARSQAAQAVLASVRSGDDGVRSEADLTQSLTRTSATSTVETRVTDISLAGALHIGSVRVRASATSGAKGKGELAIANCTVGPVPCRIDGSGVHLQDAPPVSLAQARGALDALAASGIKVFAGEAYTNPGAAVVNGLMIERATKDPTGDTVTVRTVYGYASAAAASTAAAAQDVVTEVGGVAGTPGGSDGSGVTTDTGGTGVAGTTGISGGLPGAEGIPGAAGGTGETPTVLPATPLRRLALVSRLSSGSVAWMGVGVLLWILAVGSRWAVR